MHLGRPSMFAPKTNKLGEGVLLLGEGWGEAERERETKHEALISRCLSQALIWQLQPEVDGALNNPSLLLSTPPHSSPPRLSLPIRVEILGADV